MKQQIRAFPPEPTSNIPGPVITHDQVPSQKWLDAQTTEYLRMCLPGLTGKRRRAILTELLWRDNLDTLTTFKVWAGYSAAEKKTYWTPLPKEQFAGAINDLALIECHTYRVYLHYRRTNVGNQIQYLKVTAIDADALTGPTGPAVRLGKLEL